MHICCIVQEFVYFMTATHPFCLPRLYSKYLYNGYGLPVLLLCMHMHHLFGMSGVAVPSLTSLAYYLVFLTVLVIWSFHQTVRLRVLVRVLRCILTFYTMVHLIVLYLYQFQAAQQNIPLLPDDTAKSLLARYMCTCILSYIYIYIYRAYMYTRYVGRVGIP